MVGGKATRGQGREGASLSPKGQRRSGGRERDWAMSTSSGGKEEGGTAR